MGRSRQFFFLPCEGQERAGQADRGNSAAKASPASSTRSASDPRPARTTGGDKSSDRAGRAPRNVPARCSPCGVRNRNRDAPRPSGPSACRGSPWRRLTQRRSTPRARRRRSRPGSRNWLRYGRGHRRRRDAASTAAKRRRAPAPTARPAGCCRDRSATAAPWPPRHAPARKCARRAPRAAPASAVWNRRAPAAHCRDRE